MSWFWPGILLAILVLLVLDLAVFSRRLAVGSSSKVLASVLVRLRYFRLALVSVFAALGLTLLLDRTLPLPLFLTLAVIVVILVLGANVSLSRDGHQADLLALPLSDEYLRLQELILRHARRALIILGGGTLLLVGAALLFLPGPGIPILLAGLALLATEFLWARRWLCLLREKVGLKPCRPEDKGDR